MTYEELFSQIKRKKSFLCVGLDTDRNLLPEHLKGREEGIFEFNKAIVDATAPFCVAYKPNTAFYEAEGSSGWHQLEMTVKYIRERYPEIFLIADAKRGDIGNTASQYAKAFFETMEFDAVTVAPYMGSDSIKPFLKYEGKWVVVLALTSNPSAEEFETLQVSESPEAKFKMPLYEKIIRNVMTIEGSERVMFVVGATRPEKLAEIRKYCPENFLLVPGIGAQGGTLEEVSKYGLNSHCGLLVNASRSIIYASSGENFAEAAAEAAKEFAADF